MNATLALMKEFGHVASPWKTWVSLCGIEREAGRAEAADEARVQAMATSRAYRSTGGEAMECGTSLVAYVGTLLRENRSDAAGALLHQLVQEIPIEQQPAWLPMIHALNAIIAGNRDPALAHDPALDPLAAVELQLLLKSISAPL